MNKAEADKKRFGNISARKQADLRKKREEGQSIEFLRTRDLWLPMEKHMDFDNRAIYRVAP